MAGHSKWAQIKHKKAIADAKRGAVFGRLGRAISVAARGNPDPSANPRLRAEIDRARAQNMPMDNIERAVRRVAERGAAILEEIHLECIGPGGAAIIITAITDNPNRTINELRQIAARHGTRIVSPGSVSWMFRRAGVLRIPTVRMTAADQLGVIDAGADDISSDGDTVTITCPPDRIGAVRSALGDAGVSADIEWIPTSAHSVPDASLQRTLEEALRALDDHDDVQEVQTNAQY